MQRLFKFFLNLVPRPWLIKISYWVRPLLALWYRGKKYTDPIDGKSYRRFLPYGYTKIRENVLAPGTLSLERHRLFWLYLKNETDFFSRPQKVLHFAPEQAFWQRFKKLSHLEYVTTDLNSPLADIKADIYSPLADIKADICNLPFESNGFDFIICNHVLEHIPDDRKAMEELYRVLAPGGTAILQVPYDKNLEMTFEDDSITDPKERTKIFGQYDHVRVYGMDYFEKLRSVGFEVSPIDYTATFSKEEVKTYSLSDGELLPVCKKSV